MINILIPTAGRPDMLRQALRSVRAQTARDRIRRVLVSENAGSKETGDVCREFPDLPIHYVSREPQLTPHIHHQTLMAEGLQDTYTAILHDDDWWGPGHLASAVRALDGAPQAAAYHCAIFKVNGESALLQCDTNLCFWMGAGHPRMDAIWELGRDQVLLAALLMTPGHFSSLVARTPLLRAASVVFQQDVFYDSDRRLTVALSRAGNILHNPIPQVFIRYHGSQDQRTYARENAGKLMARTTDWILQTAGVPPAEIARRFVNAVNQCPGDARDLLNSFLFQAWCVPQMACHPDMEPELRSLLDGDQKRRRRQSLRDLFPPALLAAKIRLLARLNRKRKPS